MSEIYSNIQEGRPIDVYYQDQVHLDIDGQMMYIQSGQKEIKTYIETISKPDIKLYTDSICETYIEQAKEQVEIATKQAGIAFDKASQVTQSVSTITEKSEQATLSAEQSVQYASKAALSASNADLSASNADLSATNAAESAAKASSSASDAMASAVTASEKANEVSTKVSLVEEIKSAVETAQRQATESAETARKQAVGTITENEDGSAKYWAEQAMLTLNNTVNIVDSQTITGPKTFTQTIDSESSGLDVSTIPTNTQYHFPMNIYDKNHIMYGSLIGEKRVDGSVRNSIQSIYTTNGTTYYSALSTVITNDGIPYATCVTPPTNSTGTEIVTANWVRNYVALNYNTVIEISGAGIKTAPYDGVLIITPTTTGGENYSECRITIGGNQYVCAQGFSGLDYAHVSQIFFPFKSGETYTIDLVDGCTLRYVKRGI